MSYAIVHTFPGGTKEQYMATLAVIHPADGTLPKGQIYHVAGTSANGWTIMAVHESRESWEQFREEILTPHLTKGIDGGFTSPPEETAFEIDTEMHA